MDINRVKKVIKELTNNRATGPWGILEAELVKSGTEKLFKLITQLCKELPEEWKLGCMTSIFKKGGQN